MDVYDVTARRLIHQERTLALARSARRDPCWLEQRIGLLLIAIGTRLVAERPPPNQPRHVRAA